MKEALSILAAILVTLVITGCETTNVSYFPKGEGIQTDVDGHPAFMQAWVKVDF